MKAIATTIQYAQPRDWLLLVAGPAAALVLARLDECTRRPPITSIVLTQLHWLW